jgi:hypothetical protein
MKRILALTALVVMSLAASGVSHAQDNPFVGTWKVNLAKSKYSGEQPPKSETRTVVAQGDGLQVTYQGIAADGSPISRSFTTNLDGKDSPISGTQPFGADTIAVKRVGNTLTSIAKKAGKTLYTTTSVVSYDGKIITQTTKGVNGDGLPIHITTGWDKQPNDTAGSKGRGDDIVDPPHWKQPNTP